MIASEEAAMIAPPRPCSARAPISTLRSAAVPPTSDASANTSSPVTNVRRPPKRSAARPLSIRKPANVIV